MTVPHALDPARFSVTVESELERLTRLHRAGQLTDAEFTAAKHTLGDDA